MSESGDREVYVWDPFIRAAHWALVVAFTIAFVTEDDALLIHVWAGYVVGAMVVLRVLWGLVGPRYARFSDFVYRPRAVADYVRDLLLFKAKRYLGHSPGGGAMVVVLLVSLAITVASGLVVYGAGDKAGPLAGLFAASSVAPSEVSTRLVGEEDREEDEERDDEEDESPLAEAMEELHEVVANFTLALILVHIAGVVLASLVHRENLLRAMVTGTKRR